MRAGGFALSLLAVPLNVGVLRALEEESLCLDDLRRAAGAPPQTTMRGNLRTLTELGILERRSQNRFPGSVEYDLAPAGVDLLRVSRVLEDWLGRSPEGSLRLGSPAAKNAIKALIEGWSTGIVRGLAARPFSLTEISRLIAGVSYPSLERRLTAMRLAGQLELGAGSRRGTPYVVTDWLRRASAPLTAAALWERKRASGSTSRLIRIDAEAGFLLMVPLLTLPSDVSGSCRLTMELGQAGGELQLGGVQIEVDEGRIVSCVARLGGGVDGRASGTGRAWLRALVEGETDELHFGGARGLGTQLVEGLHSALFAAPQRT